MSLTSSSRFRVWQFRTSVKNEGIDVRNVNEKKMTITGNDYEIACTVPCPGIMNKKQNPTRLKRRRSNNSYKPKYANEAIKCPAAKQAIRTDLIRTLESIARRRIISHPNYTDTAPLLLADRDANE